MEKTAEKKNRGRGVLFGMIAGIAAIVIGVLVCIISCSGRPYDRRMKKTIEPFSHDTNATGTEIVAFDMRNQKFTKEYLPKDLRASSPGDVGYILYYDDTTYSVTQDYYRVDGTAYTTPQKVTGKVQCLKLKLTDYRTGLTVASHEFTAVSPAEITSKTTSFYEKVDTKRIEEWIRSALNP